MEYTRIFEELKVGEKIKIIFDLPQPLDIVRDALGRRKIVKSCGCLSVLVNNKTFTVIYRPKPIPKSRLKAGYNFYSTTKRVTVYHTEKGKQKTEVFIIQAKIIGN